MHERFGMIAAVPDLMSTIGQSGFAGTGRRNNRSSSLCYFRSATTLPSGAYRNADLYQLLAYVVATGLPGGTLIYAADEGVNTAEHNVLQAGKRLHVVALDLSAPPAAIRRQIEVLADDIGSRLCKIGRGYADCVTPQAYIAIQLCGEGRCGGSR
jgi:hypothetical protein